MTIKTWLWCFPTASIDSSPSSNRRSHWKPCRPVQARIYNIVVEKWPFLLQRTVCHRHSSFRHIAWSTTLSPCIWRQYGCSSVNALCLLHKIVSRYFATWYEGDSDSCHQDFMIRWQCGPIFFSNQPFICLWYAIYLQLTLKNIIINL